MPVTIGVNDNIRVQPTKQKGFTQPFKGHSSHENDAHLMQVNTPDVAVSLSLCAGKPSALFSLQNTKAGSVHIFRYHLSNVRQFGVDRGRARPIFPYLSRLGHGCTAGHVPGV